MVIITAPHYLVTVITKPEVAEHLISNLKNFRYFYYGKQEFKGGIPGETSEKDMVKVEILCDRTVAPSVMNYIREYYVKDFGVIYYRVQADVQI